MRISDWSSDVCSSDLVAPGPGEDVAGPERRKEASSEGDQELVAGDRTHAFVDPAEAGHVDDEDGVARLPETRRLQYRLDLPVEAEAIGQAGQAVAQHLRAPALFRFDLGGLVDQRGVGRGPGRDWGCPCG